MHELDTAIQVSVASHTVKAHIECCIYMMWSTKDL